MKKEDINSILNNIAKELNITETQFDAAEAEYKKMGKWLDDNTKDYKIEIYPQGSFSLGTVVKPINREDEYDIDLVCEFESSCKLDAKALKSEIRSILSKYNKYESIEEKRRCWEIIYEHCRKFHMDVIPSVNQLKFINITNKNDNGSYNYIGSNPKAYINWFMDKQKVEYQNIRESIIFKEKIEKVKEYRIKTPLQKAIQILKRHRDIMFSVDKNNRKPISIIITTIAAKLYNHETDVYSALTNIIKKMPTFLNSSKKNGEYLILNPVYTGIEKENFAEKWNKHPERASAFFKWVKQLQIDFDKNKLEGMSILDFGKFIKKTLGESVSNKALNIYAEEERKRIVNKKDKVDTKTGTLTSTGTVNVPRNHHYGQVSQK